MAGKPIQIEFIASIKDVLNKTHGLELSFEDVADAIAETGKTSKKSMKQVIDGLDDVAKEAKKAEKEIDDLERGATGSFKKTGRSAKKAADDIGEGFRDSKLGEAGTEVGEELVSNLGESVSSGDSQDLLTDSAGGLIQSLPSLLGGPAGVFAAAAGAIAVGLMGRTAAKIKDRQAEVADALESVISGATDQVDLGLAGQELLEDLGEGAEDAAAAGLAKLQQLADQLGVDAGELSLALSSGTGPLADDLDQIVADVAEYTSLLNEAANNRDGLLRSSEDQVRLEELAAQYAGVDLALAKEAAGIYAENVESNKEAAALDQTRLDIRAAELEQLGLASDGVGEYAAKAEALLDAMEQIPEEQREGNEQFEALNDELQDAIDKGLELRKKNKESGETVGDYLPTLRTQADEMERTADAAERTRDAVKNTKDKTVKITVDTEVIGQARDFFARNPGRSPFG